MVTPSSCIPTSKVQLKRFELCNFFFIGVDAQPKLFFVQGGRTEGHPDVR